MQRQDEIDALLTDAISSFNQKVEDPRTGAEKPVEANGLTPEQPSMQSKFPRHLRRIYKGELGFTDDKLLEKYQTDSKFRASIPDVVEMGKNNQGKVYTKSAEGEYSLLDPGLVDPFKEGAKSLEKKTPALGAEELWSDLTDFSYEGKDLVTQGVGYAVLTGMAAAAGAPILGAAAVGAIGAVGINIILNENRLLLGKEMGLTEAEMKDLKSEAAFDVAATALGFGIQPAGKQVIRGAKAVGKNKYVVSAAEGVAEVATKVIDTVSEAYNKASGAGKLMLEALLDESVGAGVAKEYLTNPSVQKKFREITRKSSAPFSGIISNTSAIRRAEERMFSESERFADNASRALTQYYGGVVSEIQKKVPDSLVLPADNVAKTELSAMQSIGLTTNKNGRFFAQEPAELSNIGRMSDKQLHSMLTGDNIPFDENAAVRVNKAKEFFSAIGGEAEGGGKSAAYNKYQEYIAKLDDLQNSGPYKGKVGFAQYMEKRRALRAAATGDNGLVQLLRKDGQHGAAEFFQGEYKLLNNKTSASILADPIAQQNTRAAAAPKTLSGIFRSRPAAQTSTESSDDLLNIISEIETLEKEYAVGSKYLGTVVGDIRSAGLSKRSDASDKKVTQIMKRFRSGRTTNQQESDAIALAQDVLDGKADAKTQETVEDAIFARIVKKASQKGFSGGDALTAMMGAAKEVGEYATATQLIPLSKGRMAVFAGSLAGASAIEAFNDDAGLSLAGGALTSVGLAAGMTSPRIIKQFLQLANASKAPVRGGVSAVKNLHNIVSGGGGIVSPIDVSETASKKYLQGFRFLKGVFGAMGQGARETVLKDEVMLGAIMEQAFTPFAEQVHLDMGIPVPERPEPIQAPIGPAKASNKPFKRKKEQKK